MKATSLRSMTTRCQVVLLALDRLAERRDSLQVELTRRA